MAREDKAANVFANKQKRDRMAELDVILEAEIMEYNNLATELDQDIIVAYKMTHDDLDKMIGEISDGGSEDQDDS